MTDDTIMASSRWMIVVLVVVASSFILLRRNNSHSDDPFAIEPCPNPNCVRCQNYEMVQRQAVRKLRWISSLGDTDRVIKAIKTGRRHDGILRQLHSSPAFGQYPTVLLVPGLSTNPNVTDMHLHACQTLQMAVHDIRNELSDAHYLQLQSSWKRNETSSTEESAPWKVLHLMNQGRWDSSLSMLFPITMKVVKSLPNVLDNSCIFGNVFVSRLGRNTTIDVHCGPTNVRHRMHLTLQLTGDSPTLHVRNEPFEWHPDKVFAFDDSLLHRVDAGESCQERIVLIVDLWHPDLSLDERSAISHLYPMARIQ